MKGVGDALKHMRDDQTAAWNLRAGKDGKKRSAEDADSDDDEDDIHIGPPFMGFNPHITFSLGGGMNRNLGKTGTGIGMGMGMEMNRGMGGMGRIGGMG